MNRNSKKKNKKKKNKKKKKEKDELVAKCLLSDSREDQEGQSIRVHFSSGSTGHEGAPAAADGRESAAAGPAGALWRGRASTGAGWGVVPGCKTSGVWRDLAAKSTWKSCSCSARMAQRCLFFWVTAVPLFRP